MKVKDLDLNEYNLKLGGYVVKGPELRPRSQYHVNAREILKELFPTSQILEEVPIKLRATQHAFLDFFINQFKIVIEVHGQQHYKFTPLFHSSAQDFVKQKKRDADIIEWCAVNNFTYIELKFDESIETWKKKINTR